jgi:hypothetical protein
MATPKAGRGALLVGATAWPVPADLGSLCPRRPTVGSAHPSLWRPDRSCANPRLRNASGRAGSPPPLRWTSPVFTDRIMASTKLNGAWHLETRWSTESYETEQGPFLARLVRHALKRSNVLEGPLRDRIADGGYPGCQGQVATHGCHSRSWLRRQSPSSFTDELRLID